MPAGVAGMNVRNRGEAWTETPGVKKIYPVYVVLYLRYRIADCHCIYDDLTVEHQGFAAYTVNHDAVAISGFAVH